VDKLTNGPVSASLARALAERNGRPDDVIDGHAVELPS
jgi:hypothetical protein